MLYSGFNMLNITPTITNTSIKTSLQRKYKLLFYIHTKWHKKENTQHIQEEVLKFFRRLRVIKITFERDAELLKNVDQPSFNLLNSTMFISISMCSLQD